MSIRQSIVCGALSVPFLTSAAFAQGAPGDEAADAIVITLGETIEFNTNDYTPSGGFVNSSLCSDTFLNWNPTLQNEDIWFSFTPDSDMTCVFTTCFPGGFDTSMVVYQGGTGNGNMVACNGDAAENASCQQFHSELTYEVTGGLEYLVRVGGYQGASGAAALTILADPCEKAEPEVYEVSDLAGLLAVFSEGFCPGDIIRLAPGQYDFSGTLNITGSAEVIIEGTLGKGGDHLTVFDGGGDTRIIFAQAPNVTIRDIRFQNGSTGGDGGAILCAGLNLIENCVFEDNFAGAGGGAVCLTGPQLTELDGCLFTNNQATFAGAVFHPQNSNTDPTSPTLRNCDFIGNTAVGTGGGMASGGSSPTYDNCLFDGNMTLVSPPASWFSFGGGAMHFNAGGSPTVTNCIIRNNSIAGGQCGGAIWAGGGAQVSYGDNVMCANTCNGAINHLANSNGGSFSSLGGNDITDECQPDEEPCFGDINDDGIRNAADLGLLIGEWGCSSGCTADLNGDGGVNAADLGLLIGAWGACETP